MYCHSNYTICVLPLERIIILLHAQKYSYYSFAAFAQTWIYFMIQFNSLKELQLKQFTFGIAMFEVSAVHPWSCFLKLKMTLEIDFSAC